MSRNSMLSSPSSIHSLGPPCPTRLPSASAAAGPPSSLYSEYESLIPANLSPPTLDQLRELTSLPQALYKTSGLSSGSGRGGRSKNRTRQGSRLAREGQIVSKCYDAFGSRPQPTNGLTLEQSVTLEMEVVLPATITSSATSGVPTFTGLAFNLSLFTGTSTLTTVFDQYRFEQLECWIDYQAPNGTGTFPVLYSAVDLDDGNVPTALSNVQDHLGAIVATGPAGHYHKWRPHIAVASYSGAFTSYTNMPATWIDSASPNVQHYGLKLATLSSGVAYAVNATVRAVVTFRAPSIN